MEWEWFGCIDNILCAFEFFPWCVHMNKSLCLPCTLWSSLWAITLTSKQRYWKFCFLFSASPIHSYWMEIESIHTPNPLKNAGHKTPWHNCYDRYTFSVIIDVIGTARDRREMTQIECFQPVLYRFLRSLFIHNEKFMPKLWSSST